MTRTKRIRRSVAGGLGVALAATSLAVLTQGPAHAADPVDIQILATNDFHGRLANNPFGTEAGAAVLAGAVKQLRTENPNTVFAAAGDLIGASTFESFIAHDKPTIDALNEAGLEVSAVGNHEFDQGFADLVDRVMAPFDAVTNPDGGAQWKYLGANVRFKATGDPAIPATWIKDMGGVQVGFVGAVTEDLPFLVSPGGIADIEVSSIVEEANTYADELKVDGADVVVLLVHEGAPSTDCETMDDSGTWADVVNGVNDNVDAIVSGHTHLAYNCAFEVPGWAGRDVTQRPVVSAGQYGTALNKLVYSVDPDTGVITGKTQEVLTLKTGQAPNFPEDAATKAIVDDAVAEADVLGADPLGQLAGGFNRAKRSDGTTENRGGESTLGNQVAEVQRWATETQEAGGAQIAFMNPGGLRQDMLGGIAGEDVYPKTLTFKQAAVVQPFANTLVNMTLTGAQIKTVLEQQWQRTAGGAVPSRPFLRLGVSKGFTYTYAETPDAAHPGENLGHVTGMWLNNVPINPATSYSVTVNSFLATGGDNFHELSKGTGKRDTGKIDLTAMVDYMDEFAGATALPVDYAQHAVEVTFPSGAPSSYGPGEQVSFGLESLAMSAPGDLKDSQVAVSLNGTLLGSFPVTNTIDDAVYDDHGTASVAVTLPAATPLGAANLVVTGATTGTRVLVPIQVGKATPVMTVKTKPAKVVVDRTKVKVVTAVKVGTSPAAGKVMVKVGGKVYRTKLVNGRAMVKLKPFATVGKKKITVIYLGNASTTRSVTTVTIKVVKKR